MLRLNLSNIDRLSIEHLSLMHASSPVAITYSKSGQHRTGLGEPVYVRVREDMFCISAATAAGSDIANSSLFSEEEVRISKIKVLPPLPVGPTSLLTQIVPNLAVRRLIASFLTSRCTMCDENKASLNKDLDGVFRFYCIDCFTVASE